MIRISSSLVENLIQEVESIPEETCGFLLGKTTENENNVLHYKPVANVSTQNRSKHYVIDPKDYLRTEAFSIETQTALIGIYHTHLDWPAIPSETDRLAAFPNVSYVIISLRQLRFSEIKSWRLNDTNQFLEEKIHIITQ
ncbi:Mov34/MPN/PAD-1 family protein [Cyclobacterium jeungdonense]|uniref:M67 family metallopeptidase n=1 Tax=Cyclobacterium jeungdonense TaxID=708087 RepID=A0ABT8C3V1_9BACT|nr:M67 family metallopeptidase [Cyclobacterium jeungdonense]MDN3686714.1 M67 family metallopeptidase [Cyclobacterium jeungdonense]